MLSDETVESYVVVTRLAALAACTWDQISRPASYGYWVSMRSVVVSPNFSGRTRSIRSVCSLSWKTALSILLVWSWSSATEVSTR